MTSDKRFQSLSETESILKSSSLKGKALENAVHVLHILSGAEGRVHGVARSRPTSSGWGRWTAARCCAWANEETVPGCKYRG